MAWAMYVLSLRGRGLPISHLPPQLLVETGPFAVMRHPIYVGYNGAVMGAGYLVGSIGRTVVAPGFLWLGWMIYAVGFEEPRLAERLGDPYRSYMARVPLLPFAFVGLLGKAMARFAHPLSIGGTALSLVAAAALIHAGTPARQAVGLCALLGAMALLGLDCLREPSATVTGFQLAILGCSGIWLGLFLIP